MSSIEKYLMTYREKDLEGKIVNLSPVKYENLSSIVRMRNDPKMMYYFNQPMELTLENQKEWYKKYLKRCDDLYWTIKDKNGLVIGTNRLYDITDDKCVQGSLMVDTKYSRTAPFAIEGMLLSLNFAFDILKVKTIINEDRNDNKNMNSLSKRFGFQFLRETEIRGVSYNYYELQKEKYNRSSIEEVLRMWLER